MSTHDKFGRAWATHADTTAGTILEADSNMGGCMKRGDHKVVKFNSPGGLHVDCAHGRHYLDGQVDYQDGDAVYVGFYNVTKEKADEETETQTET